MFVLILQAELHLPSAQSLKAKRSAVTPIIRHIDRLEGVAASEVDYHDKWQRTTIGISAVGNSVSHLNEVVDGVERYLWSRPDAEVIELTRSWWDED